MPLMRRRPSLILLIVVPIVVALIPSPAVAIQVDVHAFARVVEEAGDRVEVVRPIGENAEDGQIQQDDGDQNGNKVQAVG